MPSGWREPCPRVNFARRSPGPGPAGRALPSRERARPAGEGPGPGHPSPAAPGRPRRPAPGAAREVPTQLVRTCPRSTPPAPRGVYARSPNDDIRPRGPARECPGRGRARRGRGRRAGAGSQLPNPPRSARGADHWT